MIKIINGVTVIRYNSIDEVPKNNIYSFIDENVLPKGISVSDIDDIIGKVADFIDSFDNQISHGLPLFEYPFDVRFSDETPVRIYGHKTISDIKKELIDLLLEKLNSLNEEKYQNFKKYYENLIDDINKAVKTGNLMELASQIAERLVDRHDDEYENNEKNQYEDLKEMVVDIIQSCAFESPVLGSFNYVSNWKGSLSNTESLEIVLYVNNIYNAKDNFGGLLNAFEAVIAHEMFHYYHFCKTEITYYDYKHNDNIYIPWEFSQRNDYLSSVVKESFASCFEWLYCTENNISNDVSRSWYEHSISIYPYSGARYINDKNDFIYLVNKSLENGMNDVLFEMLDDIKKYYQIINPKFIVYNKTMSNNSNAINVDLDLIENQIPNILTNEDLFDYNKIFTTNFIVVPTRSRDTFADMLEDIQNKMGLSKYQVCKRCCIDKTQYNRLLGARMDFPSRPARETVYKICIGLELGYEEAMKVIKIAGYSKTDYLDDLIEHCLKHSYYNKDEIDSTLKKNHYKTLFNTDTFDDYYEENKDKEIDITKGAL